MKTKSITFKLSAHLIATGKALFYNYYVTVPMSSPTDLQDMAFATKEAVRCVNFKIRQYREKPIDCYIKFKIMPQRVVSTLPMPTVVSK